MSVRKISNRGSNNVIGKFPSYKTGKTVWWESKLERDYLYLLEFDSDVRSYKEQPVRIVFELNGLIRRYTPDFLVERTNKKQLVEVKPQEKVFKGDGKQRYLTISRVCRSRGYQFRILTEAEIRRQPRLRNIKLFYKYARTVIAPQHQILCKEFFRDKTSAPLREIIKYFTDREVNPSVVYALLFHTILVVDIMQPITLDSVVRLAGPTPITRKEPQSWQE